MAHFPVTLGLELYIVVARPQLVESKDLSYPLLLCYSPSSLLETNLSPKLFIFIHL